MLSYVIMTSPLTQKRHIASLFMFLSMIRRPYLDMKSKGRRNDTQEEREHGDDAFARWQGASSLTESERDEVDFQVKLVIKQCLGRVHELERGEQRMCM